MSFDERPISTETDSIATDTDNQQKPVPVTPLCCSQEVKMGYGACKSCNCTGYIDPGRGMGTSCANCRHDYSQHR